MKKWLLRSGAIRRRVDAKNAPHSMAQFGKQEKQQRSSLEAKATGSVEATLPHKERGNALRGFDGSGPRPIWQSLELSRFAQQGTQRGEFDSQDGSR